MSKVKISPHYIPTHGRPEDMRFTAENPGPAVKVLYSSKPDPGHLNEVLRTTGDRLVILRDWALSEQHDDARRSPVDTGVRHAREWHDHLGETGVPLDRILVEGLNEPPVWETISPFVTYYLSFAVEAARLGLHTVLLNLSVGWPGNGGEGMPPDWGPYEPVLTWLEGHPGNFLGLHEYWGYNTGVLFYGGWWFLRHRSVPGKVPIILTELGGLKAEQHADGGWGLDGGKGWKGDPGLPAGAYVTQWKQAEAELKEDPRVFSAHLFTTDGGHPWIEECDANPCNDMWLNWANAQTELPKFNVYLPVTPVTTVVRPPAPPAPSSDSWARSIQFVLAWEGGYVDNPADPGGETKYGISKASYPGLDIKNLTKEQAVDIYRRDYWEASGADRLPWPLCLAHFDLAVNGGVGRAQDALTAAGPHFVPYMAWRLAWYTRIAGFDTFGKAWVRRCADLMTYSEG